MQKQFNPYAAGRKVYATGSFAPSTGANNKKGYIAREQRRKNFQRKKKNLKAPSSDLAMKALRFKLRHM